MLRPEDDKITSLIQDYQQVMDTIEMDISHSAQGRWYASRWNEEKRNYDFFIEFHTAEQLKEILTGESAIYLKQEGCRDIAEYVDTVDEDINYRPVFLFLLEHADSILRKIYQ